MSDADRHRRSVIVLTTSGRCMLVVDVYAAGGLKGEVTPASALRAADT